VVKSSQQERCGFSRTYDEFSRAVGHVRISSCTRIRGAPQLQRRAVRSKEKARKVSSGPSMLLEF
jgi:hypothetical protein